MFSKYIHVIKNGKVITDTFQNETIKCDRCHKSNTVSYITHDNMDLCFPCVDIINTIVNNKKKINPNEILLRMEIDIYKNKNIYINNDMNYINEIHPIRNISEFRLVDKINDDFKVSINNKIYIMNENNIIRHYWDYLSFYDKDYFLNK
jgi:hypothetical protein